MLLSGALVRTDLTDILRSRQRGEVFDGGIAKEILERSVARICAGPGGFLILKNYGVLRRAGAWPFFARGLHLDLGVRGLT